jgi:hypothetical protein
VAGVSIPDCASSVVSQYTPFDVGAMSWASPVTVAMVRCGHWLENTFVTVAGGCGGDVVGVGNGRAAVVGGAVDRVTGRISVADFAPPQAETRSAAVRTAGATITAKGGRLKGRILMSLVIRSTSLVG